MLLTKDGDLAETDEMILRETYGELLKISVAYMLFHRCGLNADDMFTRENFTGLELFTSPEAVTALGMATSDIAQICLREIAATVRAAQKNEIRTLAIRQGGGDNKGRTIPAEERMENDESTVQDGKRIPGARHRSQYKRHQAGTAGTKTPRLPEREPQGVVHRPDDKRDADANLQGRGNSGDRTDGTGYIADGAGPGRGRSVESGGSDAVGWADEQHPKRGDGDGAGRPDLSSGVTTQSEPQTEEPKAEGDPSAFSIPAQDDNRPYRLLASRFGSFYREYDRQGTHDAVDVTRESIEFTRSLLTNREGRLRLYGELDELMETIAADNMERMGDTVELVFPDAPLYSKSMDYHEFCIKATQNPLNDDLFHSIPLEDEQPEQDTAQKPEEPPQKQPSKRKRKKAKEDYAKQLEDSFNQWDHYRTQGGSDPFWPDGTNMNLIRNHILLQE